MIGLYQEFTGVNTGIVDIDGEPSQVFVLAGTRCVVRVENDPNDPTAEVKSDSLIDLAKAMIDGDPQAMQEVASKRQDEFATKAGVMCANCVARYGGCDVDPVTTPSEGKQVLDTLYLTSNKVFIRAYTDESLEL
jgi:hypothetical protein